MPELKQFKLPDLGEGLTEGEILAWLVKVGDVVTLNQPLVEVETAKAAVELPSPFAGRVTELMHEEGETVPVGSPIVTIDVDPDGETPPSPTVEEEAVEREAVVTTPPAEAPAEPGMVGSSAPGASRTAVLVGYGVRSGSVRRRPRKGAATGPPSAPPAAPLPPARVSAEQVGAAAARAAGAVTVLATPPVRKLAKDLGVELRTITGTGPGGTISRDDVSAAADTVALAAASPTPEAPAPPQLGPAPTPAATAAIGRAFAFDPDTREHRILVRGVQRAMAAAMVSSAFTAPHVTEFVQIDVTASVDLLTRLATLRDFADVRLSPLTLVARALTIAVARHPLVNASWDAAADEIVVKQYVNLGIAAATPRGLVVPNVKDAGRLSLIALARALNDLTDRARAGRILPADSLGGTITITNVGVFGIDSGTPILNPGEAAILCLGAVRPMPWVHEGALAVRQVTTLGLSFDHRIVDGALGSSVLADVAAMLADPTLMVAWA